MVSIQLIHSVDGKIRLHLDCSSYMLHLTYLLFIHVNLFACPVHFSIIVSFFSITFFLWSVLYSLTISNIRSSPRDLIPNRVCTRLLHPFLHSFTLPPSPPLDAGYLARRGHPARYRLPMIPFRTICLGKRSPLAGSSFCGFLIVFSGQLRLVVRKGILFKLVALFLWNSIKRNTCSALLLVFDIIVCDNN